MNKRKRLVMRSVILVVIALALGYTLFQTVFSDKKEPVAVGDTAPNFALKNLDGKEVELEDYKGKGVFLNFWGTYCPPCEKEMPAIQRQYEKYKDQGVVVLAVDIAETKLTVKKFVDEKNLTFPVVLDQQREVVDVYGVGNLPATYLISPEGKVIDKITGELNDTRVRNYMEQIKP
ncbi:thiol-disulfide oxidoreductase ResA [Pseudalkalibacillus berkeleyi]|uniref:Thiol-disulfide oxidoreductase ResA n=1 Tax=Pseudalkalibacillus berkeleyi TaxID=1069813 RepID=A0ABS9GXZ0_9BACL|nr:thiol-disulfide oxidoreductase ResA [Pseudalkalibacillus berkeleyi]MCF6137623.1 thiol-disulfide oxidoreductase ResA [Pseudalkalibacillus berkeleyi]